MSRLGEPRDPRNDEKRVYLIHLEMPKADQRRLGESLPVLRAVLRKLGTFEQLYNSPGVDLIGFILQTNRVAGQIRAAINGGDGTGSATRNGDRYMILEIGADFYWEGFGAIDAMLRHRATSAQKPEAKPQPDRTPD